MPTTLAEWRDDTPATAHLNHLNNAGSSLPPRQVIDATVAHLHREAEIGGYEAAAEAAPRLDAVYASIALLIGAAPHEIALVENATRGWDMAFYGFPFERGTRLLTGRAEYASNVIAMLQMAQRHDLDVVVVDDDEHGQIDLDALDRELTRSDVAMVALTHVPTSGGLVNPAAAVGARCRAAGVPFLLDACQSAGQMPLDVAELGCDILSATGRKFLRAPRGTGFLYVREPWIERIEPPLLDLHSAEWTSTTSYAIRGDAKRFESWESSIASRLGLGAAVDYALDADLQVTWSRIVALADRLRAGLAEVPGVEVHDQGLERCGLVTFTKDGETAMTTMDRLRSRRINTSVSSGQRAILDLGARGIDGVVRASVHYFNTDDEIDAAIEAVRG